MLIFSILNHPCSFMVYYYLFEVALSWANYVFQVSFNLKDNFVHCQHKPSKSVSSGVRKGLLKWYTITQRQSEVLRAGTFNNTTPAFWTMNLNNFAPPLSVLLYLFALTILGPRVHVLKCGTAGKPLWETVIMSPGIALAGNRWVSVTCNRLSVSTDFTQYQQLFVFFK